MTFKPEAIESFREMFVAYRERIASAEGCTHLELLQDKHDPRIFFTVSNWKDESFLEKYRKSDLFGEVWPITKGMFEEPAEAWTCDAKQ